MTDKKSSHTVTSRHLSKDWKAKESKIADEYRRLTDELGWTAEDLIQLAAHQKAGKARLADRLAIVRTLVERAAGIDPEHRGISDVSMLTVLTGWAVVGEENGKIEPPDEWPVSVFQGIRFRLRDLLDMEDLLPPGEYVLRRVDESR